VDSKNIILKENTFKIDDSVLERGLVKNPQSPSRKSTIEKVLKTFLDHERVYTSGTWTWICSQQKELFDTLRSASHEEVERQYSNFFRNRVISNGLVSSNLLESMGGGDWKDRLEEQNIQYEYVFTQDGATRRNFIDLLMQDIHTCKELTGLDDISRLDVSLCGNPYGIRLGGSLITSDEPRHFCDATRIYEMTIDIAKPVIYEIGGGHGGLLSSLFKVFGDKKFIYINCDILPTALSFIYMIENGEKERNVYINSTNTITKEEMRYNNIILNIYSEKILSFERSIDVVFNSHSLSEMDYGDVKTHMSSISKSGASYFYHINSNSFPWKQTKKGHIDVNASDFPIEGYKKLTHSISPWVCGGNSRYREFLYERK